MKKINKTILSISEKWKLQNKNSAEN